MLRRVAWLLVCGARAVLAQGAPPADRACDTAVHRVAVRLLDRAGTPVPDAAILVRRVLRRTLVHSATSLGQGRYRVLADGDVSDLRAGGEPFDVTFRLDDRQHRVRLIIGTDAARCHVALKAGRTTVRLP